MSLTGLSTNGHTSGHQWTPDDLAAFAEADRQDHDWLAGVPMDPAAESPEAAPPLPGWPFLPDAGAAVLIVGPTGGGRSSLVHACLYDGTQAGLAAIYLGHEVIEVEFQARTASLAEKRGDNITDELRARLSHVRYLELGETIARAWEDPAGWRTGIVGRYRVVVIDPLSAVETALGLDFQGGGGDYLKFHDRLIQPLVAEGVIVVCLDNVGHSIDAKSRARGDSAKTDRADLAFACSTIAQPAGLKIRATKVRSTRAGIRRDDAWTIDRDTQTVTRVTTSEAPGEAPAFRPTLIMERVSRHLEDANEPAGSKRLRTLVKGKNEYVDIAATVLVAEGYAHHTADGYVHIKPYRETDDPKAGAPQGAPSPVPPVPPVPQGAPDGAPTVGKGGAPSAHTPKGGARGNPDWTDDRAEALLKRHAGSHGDADPAADPMREGSG